MSDIFEITEEQREADKAWRKRAWTIAGSAEPMGEPIILDDTGQPVGGVQRVEILAGGIANFTLTRPVKYAMLDALLQEAAHGDV